MHATEDPATDTSALRGRGLSTMLALAAVRRRGRRRAGAGGEHDARHDGEQRHLERRQGHGRRRRQRAAGAGGDLDRAGHARCGHGGRPELRARHHLHLHRAGDPGAGPGADHDRVAGRGRRRRGADRPQVRAGPAAGLPAAADLPGQRRRWCSTAPGRRRTSSSPPGTGPTRNARSRRRPAAS